MSAHTVHTTQFKNCPVHDRFRERSQSKWAEKKFAITRFWCIVLLWNKFELNVSTFSQIQQQETFGDQTGFEDRVNEILDQMSGPYSVERLESLVPLLLNVISGDDKTSDFVDSDILLKLVEVD